MSGVERSPALPIASNFEARPFKRPNGFTEKNSSSMYSLMSWGYIKTYKVKIIKIISCSNNLTGEKLQTLFQICQVSHT